MATLSKNLLQNIYPRLKSESRRWLKVAGGFTSRFILILIILIIATWLSYQNVWRPLQEEITLPAGVLNTNPLLRSELLQQINADRVERSRYQPGPYDGYSRLFTSAETLPTPTVQPTSQTGNL